MLLRQALIIVTTEKVEPARSFQIFGNKTSNNLFGFTQAVNISLGSQFYKKFSTSHCAKVHLSVKLYL